MTGAPPAMWVAAEPTAAQERSGQSLADPAFHHAVARAGGSRGASLGVLLSEELACRRGPGGRTVAQAWADSGAQVAVTADSDPGHQADSRQLLVDRAASVVRWGERVRDLGATIACWHTLLDAPEGLLADYAESVPRLLDSGLDPMVRIHTPVVPLDGPGAFGQLGALLERLDLDRSVLARLTVCVPMPTPPHAGRGLGARLLDGLLQSVPDGVGAVVVSSSRQHVHLAQADAGDLAAALSRRTTPWPVAHSAGDLALRAAAAWWRVPEVAHDPARRLGELLDLLAGPMASTYTGWPTEDPATGEPPAPPAATGPRELFDTSLFRKRSLYRQSPVSR